MAADFQNIVKIRDIKQAGVYWHRLEPSLAVEIVEVDALNDGRLIAFSRGNSQEYGYGFLSDFPGNGDAIGPIAPPAIDAEEWK